MSLCSSDWLRLNCGDPVHALDDERHTGRVRAIFNAATVRVVWDDTGWISDLLLGDVVRVRRVRT